MKPLYPEIEPYAVFHLDVDTRHQVYVEQCGNPNGLPVIYFHGGPASGCKPDHRSFFDPAVYRIILFDQRGCGRSEPYGELQDNTTQHLLEDIEAIRRSLNIERWVLYGGSWGATLALLYAQQHPEKVLAMILRGSFLARRSDLEWFAGRGANLVYPEAWQHLLDSLAISAGHENPMQVLTDALHSDDDQRQQRAAWGWSLWGAQVALANLFDLSSFPAEVDAATIQQVRIEAHYAQAAYFIRENQILEHCKAVQKIPTTILHGREDLVCPLEAAYSLYQQLPHASYRVLEHSGHIAQGEEMIDALVDATDRIAQQLAAQHG